MILQRFMSNIIYKPTKFATSGLIKTRLTICLVFQRTVLYFFHFSKIKNIWNVLIRPENEQNQSTWGMSSIFLENVW